jgi:carbonic anhydrase
MGRSRCSGCGLLDGRPAIPDRHNRGHCRPASPLQISRSKRPDTIVNNGHTIQLGLATATLKFGERSLKLTQFDFHHPSEHLVEGNRFAMGLVDMRRIE